MTRYKYFHDDQIQGAWCDIKSLKMGERLDCSKCENNPEVPRCNTCVHFIHGKCEKVRGDIIFGGIIGYSESMIVRENQVACSFYTKNDTDNGRQRK